MPNSIAPFNYMLEKGYIYYSSKPALICAVVSSSVGVCLYDSKQKRGAMNHFKFPELEPKQPPTAYYAPAALTKLLQLMIDNGSEKKNLRAQIVGGALKPIDNCKRFFSSSELQLGSRNVETAKKFLAKNTISIIKIDTGGSFGRKVVFNTFTGECQIFKADRIRETDWN